MLQQKQVSIFKRMPTHPFLYKTKNKYEGLKKIPYYNANNLCRAPNGCLQYFTGARRHTVTSFNWVDGTGKCATGCFLQNQDYRVCFRDEAGNIITI